MAKGSRGRRRIASRQCRPTPYPLFSDDQKKFQKVLEKKDWEGATCPVCMEYPHNAVLLLCSSHDNGCRPYMCGTSCRYSNCLDQYKKAYTKVNPSLLTDSQLEVSQLEASQLACPLCRGQVKGWTVVEPAREYLNLKKRTCMEDGCAFFGTFKELRKHVKSEHPWSRPREVDPVEEQKWSRLERERERDDVISTIRSSMPGAMVFGDYVIEGSHYGFDDSDDDVDEGFNGGERNGMGIDSNLVNVFLLLHAFDSAAGNVRPPPPALFGGGGRGRFDSSDSDDSDSDDDGGGGGGGDDVSLVGRLRREGRVLLGRSGRRRRRYREDNNGGES